MTREDAIEVLEYMKAHAIADGFEEELDMAIDALQAEAVQGEWGHMIVDGTDGSHWYEYECSHCGEVVLRPYNYCPYCGARMYREDGEL